MGTLTVRRPDGSFVRSSDWRTTKVKDLLRLLALEAGSPVKTEVLMERLWPGADPGRAGASLRTATYQLRKSLDTDCLERTPGALTLIGAWTDAQAYTATADAVLARTPRRLGELATVVELVREAEALYVGDLDVHDSSDDRLRETAEHLRARRVELLVEGAEAAGELLWTRESLAFASRAFQADDTSERAGRALMRAFAGLGDTTRALEVYERLRSRLARQFGADPAPQTRALHLHLLDGGAGPDIEPGRIRIGLEPLTDLVASALLRVREASPSGGVVVLRTPPGSGWEAALEHACDGLGLSHGRLGLEAAHVLGPAFASDDTGLDTNREHAEVVTLPAATSLAEPVQELIALLVRSTRSTVLVPVPHDLELPDGRLRWPGSGTVEVVTVERLTSPELEALARSILRGAPSPALLRALTIESAGLPGSAIEVLRRWLDAGRIVWTAAGLDVRPLDEEISTSVGSVRAYVTALSRTAIDVLGALCVAGARLSAEQVDAVAAARHPHQTVDVQAALDELVAAGLVAAGPAGFALTPSAAADELVAWLDSPGTSPAPPRGRRSDHPRPRRPDRPLGGGRAPPARL